MENEIGGREIKRRAKMDKDWEARREIKANPKNEAF